MRAPIFGRSAVFRPDETRKRWLLDTGIVVAVAAVLKLLLHLYAGRNYGYFVDELYYLACAQHLAWGYVDQPPLIGLIANRSPVVKELSAHGHRYCRHGFFA